MRLSKLLQLVSSLTSLLICEVTFAAGDSTIVKPITQLGVHSRLDHRFTVVLRKDSMGGGTDLFVMKGNEPIFYAGDVTGYFWVDNIMVYSSLPLYGSAGIYAYDPIMETRSALIDGQKNEYFQLKSYSPDTRKLAYYYSGDISQVDTAALKAATNGVRELLMPQSH